MTSIETKVFELIAVDTPKLLKYSIDDVLWREITIDGDPIILQHNPARAVSSGAQVDPKSIAARPCFLCQANRPTNQLSVELCSGYEALVNPFPILRNHLTIPRTTHRQQEIRPMIAAMLDISEMLPSFVILYNGPRCGASAPDHAHFQAFTAGQTPMERHLPCKSGEARVDDFVEASRRCIMITAPSKDAARDQFLSILDALPVAEGEYEPKINLFARYHSDLDQYVLHVYPRRAHRPSCYGTDCMISPGAIDMAGVMVLPLRSDFDIADEALIRSVYREVSLL